MKKRIIVLVLSILLMMPNISYASNDDINLGKTLNSEYLNDITKLIKKKYHGEISDKKILESVLKGIFGELDPYTNFFTNEEAKAFMGNMRGTYKGIGIMITKADEYILVSKVFDSSPAQKAGLLSGDAIIEVEETVIIGSFPDEAAKLIKGEDGTFVNLKIKRAGNSELISLKVKRADIKINPVMYRTNKEFGYIKLDIFNLNSSVELKEALDYMDEKNINKIILDLRGNPGGDLQQAVQIARSFVPKGLITKLDMKDEETKDEEYFSYLEETKYKMAVLIDEGSASASEVLAGAIQDTKSGTLIGTKSFGKAKVQSLIPILTPEAYEKTKKEFGVNIVNGHDMEKAGGYGTDEDIIGWSKITTGRYLTPNGRMIDGVGLQPDILVENPEKVKNIDLVSFKRMSKLGKYGLESIGVEVYYAERILKILGYDVDTPDMNLDEKTFNSIMKFQEDSELFPYGVIDFATQDALNSSLNSLDIQYIRAVEFLE